MSLPGINALIQWARDYAVLNLPATGANLPGKNEFRLAITQLGLDIVTQAAGLIRYETRAVMNADTSKPLGTQARVYADATAANNTVYIYKGSPTPAWVIDTDYLNAVGDSVATIVDPLVDEAAASAADAAASAASVRLPYDGLYVGWLDFSDTYLPTHVVLNIDDGGESYWGADGKKHVPNAAGIWGPEVVSGSGSSSLAYVPVRPTAQIDDPTTLIREQAGSTVILPAITLYKPSGNVSIAVQTVTLDAVTSSGPITNEAANPVSGYTHTLSFGSLAISSVYMGWRYFTGLTVRRASNNALLARGTDYDYVDNGMGRLWGLQNVAAYAVLLSYTGYASRYDIIYCDQVTGVIGIAKGTDRGIDPERYPPVLPSGKIELFRAYVTYSGVELVPTLNFHNGVKVGNEAAFENLKAYNRSCMPKFLKALNAGSPVTIIQYGDSRGSMGGATTPFPAIQIIANGNGKDSTSFFNPFRLPSDTLAGYTTYTQAGDADFTNFVSGSTGHVKLGWIWYVIKAIQQRYASNVIYENWCIAGSKSDNSIQNPGSGSDRYNGLYPARLSAATAAITAAIGAGRTVLVYGSFGMNELGSANTYANHLALADAFRTAGAEYAIMGCEHPSVDAALSESTWEATNEALLNAAYAKQAAIIPVHMIEGVPNEGAEPLSSQSYGNDNYNHLSPVQAAYIGRFAAMCLIPDSPITLPGEIIG